MGKNGQLYISIVRRKNFITGTWNPYDYREIKKQDILSKYVSAKKIESTQTPVSSSFIPIEYRHIPKGKSLTFDLERMSQNYKSNNIVGEEVLLFGTMRAYLGNLIITPKAEWIDLKAPIFFAIKAEFVEINPLDGLPCFWWAYLRSPSFLHNLPAGSGGTRPRLDLKALLRTPVSVPPIRARKKINKKIELIMRKAWKNYVQMERIYTSMRKPEV